MGRCCPGVHPAAGSTHPVGVHRGRGPFRSVLHGPCGRPVRTDQPVLRPRVPAEVEGDGHRSAGPWSFSTRVFDLPRVVRSQEGWEGSQEVSFVVVVADVAVVARGG